MWHLYGLCREIFTLIYGVSGENNVDVKVELVELINKIDENLILDEVKLVSYGTYRVYFNKV